MKYRSLCVFALLTNLYAAPVSAAGVSLFGEPFEGRKLRIDGVPGDWPGKFSDLTVTVKGRVRDADPRVSGNLGYDEKNLYVALHVRDAKLVRTKGAGQGEDHATLLLAFPDGRGRYNTYDLDLYPGQAGKTAGIVKKGNQSVKGSKLVEAPTDEGFTLEAQIPWSAFPEAATVRVGLRAALRYTDADAPGQVKAVVGTSAAGSGGDLPAFLLEPEQGLDASLIRGQNLTGRPAFVRYANIAGDAFVERVAIYANFLSIVGPHYRGGKQFYFAELGVSDAKQVKRLDLVDVDGDGRQEIVIQKRIGGTDKYREILQVTKVGTDDQPFVVFEHEVGIKTLEGSIANEVSIKRRGKGAAILISQGDAEGFEPDSYAEPLPAQMPSALLPWQTIKSRTFEWRGDSVQKTDEANWTPKVAKKTGSKSKSTKSSSAPPPPPPPRPPSAEELQDRLYALYRKDRGVGKTRPSFDFSTDVAEDSSTERVLIHDKDIVVFGKNFRGGASYAYITVGVADKKDILDVTARDLTGDGKAEIIVRGVLHAKASDELGGDVVDRHALLIYKVVGERVVRIFGAETGRAIGDRQVLGGVAFKPSDKGVRIELRPARAVGWTAKTYPFPADSGPAGGLEPLLLPWGSAHGKSYRFDGTSFVER